jgi:two-component system repressor protein LuxO
MSDSDFTQLLLIEDDLLMAKVYCSYLKQLPYKIHHVDNGEAALQALNTQQFDGVLLDLTLPDINGIEVLKKINKEQLPIAVIVITGDCSMSTAIEAMQLGAKDYLVKPFNKERLSITLKNSFETQNLQRIVEVYREQIDRKQFCDFIGSSIAMQKIYQVIDSAASSKATIFVTGESGTGKEICAQALHQRSERSHAPFIAINCGAIPKDLIESEIFGHVKGAFTGALSERSGAAKAADGGTLFLDEICEMELSLQTKLLRFLQTGTVNKVGSDRTEKVDVRIICASNKNPQTEVQLGNFREDLFYRLHVLPIHLPPLRERDNDVIEIARSFLNQYADEEGKKFQRLDAETESVLSSYEWPGNVRQLQNVVRNIVVLHDGESVTTNMLPAPLDSYSQPTTHSTVPQPSTENIAPTINRTARVAPEMAPLPATDQLQNLIRPIATLEREAIEEAINLCDGNIPTAAHYLQISAATIYRKRSSWQKHN